MDSHQRQTVLFIGFFFLVAVVTIFVLQETGASGPGLGEFLPEGFKEFVNDTKNAWSDIFEDAQKTKNLTG